MIEQMMKKYQFMNFSKKQFHQFLEEAKTAFLKLDDSMPLEKKEQCFLKLFEKMVKKEILSQLCKDKHLTVLKRFLVDSVDFSCEDNEDIKGELNKMAAFLQSVSYSSNFLRMKLLLEEFPSLSDLLGRISFFDHDTVNRSQLEQFSDDFNVSLLLEMYCVKEKISIMESEVVLKPSSKDQFTDNILLQYFQDVNQIRPLTNQETSQLLDRIKQGDTLAKQRFVEGNLRLVLSVAKKYFYCGVSPLDVIQEGNMGLMKAVDKFDSDRGIAFSTYARYWVFQSIHRFCSNHKNLFSSSHTDIDDATSFSHEKSNDLVCSLDSFDSESLIATSSAVDDAVLDRMIQEEIYRFLDQFPKFSDREREVMKQRYGHKEVCFTQQNVADKFGVTRQRIMQIEHKAIKKLRDDKNAKHFFDYISEESKVLVK